MPAGVPGATITSVPTKVTPGLVDETKVVVTNAGSTNIPFNVSLAKTLVNDVPPTYPFTDSPASFTASIEAALTVTVTTAVSQLVGFKISQI